MFTNFNAQFKTVLINGETKSIINKQKDEIFKGQIEDKGGNCYQIRLGNIGCIDTDNEEAELFVKKILNKLGKQDEFIKTKSISNLLLNGVYAENHHRLFIIPDDFKPVENLYKIGGGNLDLLFSGILYEPITDFSYKLPIMTPHLYNELKKFKPNVKTSASNEFYNQSKFWDIIENKFNHSELAKVFYNLNGDNFVYNRNLNWFSYNKHNVLVNFKKGLPTNLKNDVTDTIQNYIKQNNKPSMPLNLDLSDTEYKEERKRNDKRLQAVKKAYNTIGTSSFIDGVIDYLKMLYNNDEIEHKLNQNTDIIAFNNAVYDYIKGEFRDIKKTDYVSITTGYNAPKERNQKLIEEINNLILSVFNTQEMAEYFKISTALSFFSNKYETLYMHWGSGGNGKGLLSNIIQKALGPYFMTAENTFLTSVIKAGCANPTLSNARFCRYLLVSEPDNGSTNCHLNPDFIKSITGRDLINTRALYGDTLTYTPQFTVNVQCNSQPSLNKLDKGMSRRLSLMPYINSFVQNPTKPNEKKVNPNLKSAINDEFINNFMILMLDTAYQYNNINTITKPQIVQDATNEYMNDNNPIKNFIDEYYINDNTSKVNTTEFRMHYEATTGEKIQATKLKEALVLNGYKVIKQGLSFICNLKLKPDAPTTDDIF